MSSSTASTGIGHVHLSSDGFGGFDWEKIVTPETGSSTVAGAHPYNLSFSSFLVVKGVKAAPSPVPQCFLG